MDTLLLRVDNAVFSDAGVRHLIPLKESLQEFEMNVESCLKCLTHLLENEEAMLGLLLTERHEAIIKGESLDRSLHRKCRTAARGVRKAGQQRYQRNQLYEQKITRVNRSLLRFHSIRTGTESLPMNVVSGYYWNIILVSNDPSLASLE